MQQSLKAREFAEKAHDQQTYGPEEPYMVHVDAVAALVGNDDTAQTVAYLHDVVEDTPVTLEKIKVLFGGFVAECVDLLTDPVAPNRKDRKAKSHAKLAGVGPSHYVALLVKVADRCANVEACVRKGNRGLLEMYRKEHSAFYQAAYRPGLCDLLWGRIDRAFAA